MAFLCLNRVRASFSPALLTPPCMRLRTGRFIAIMNNGTLPIALQSRLNLAILASCYLKQVVPPSFSLGDNIPLNSDEIMGSASNAATSVETCV